MRILFLAPRFPLPAVKGDKLRAWHFIRLLSEAHDVTLLTYVSTRTEQQFIPQVESVCPVIAVPFRRVPRTAGLAAACWNGYPLQALLYRSKTMMAHVARLLPENDVVHCNTLRMAANLPAPCPAPLVVDFIDAISAAYRRRAQEAGFPVNRLFQSEARRLEACEARLKEKAAFSCAVSAEDARALGSGVAVVPHGVDTEEFCPPPPGQLREGIIFTGNLAYPPNVQAAVSLARDIFPKILRAVPQAHLRLVGIDPSPRVRALATDRIEVTGYVDSVADELRKSAVAAAPVRSGSGVKTKILEAMGCATPVVATPEAIAGIPAADGGEFLLADGHDAFADKTIALLQDRAKAEEIGQAGSKFVQERFSWKTTGQALLDRYAQLESSLP